MFLVCQAFFLGNFGPIFERQVVWPIWAVSFRPSFSGLSFWPDFWGCGCVVFFHSFMGKQVPTKLFQTTNFTSLTFIPLVIMTVVKKPGKALIYWTGVDLCLVRGRMTVNVVSKETSEYHLDFCACLFRF